MVRSGSPWGPFSAVGCYWLVCGAQVSAARSQGMEVSGEGGRVVL